MRELVRLCFLATCVTAVVMLCPAHSFGQASEDGLTSRTVTLRLGNASFIRVLVVLAVEHRVPIGLEVADDDADGPRLDIDVSNETLKNVLDLITRQEPDYRWEVKDGVINFVPARARDPFLSQLLDTRVVRFAPEKGVNKYGLRDALTNLPEVKRLLDANGMTVWRLGPPTYRSVYTNDEVDLSISDTDVRGVLNKVIRDSEHKLWVVSRRSHTKNTIQINF